MRAVYQSLYFEDLRLVGAASKFRYRAWRIQPANSNPTSKTCVR